MIQACRLYVAIRLGQLMAASEGSPPYITLVIGVHLINHATHVPHLRSSSDYYNWGEPHTNHVYEKIAVPMYVCMYVALRRGARVQCN